MAQAIYRHGQPLMLDYTPGSAVTAGDVIVVGDQPRIAHSDIAASALGALAAGGGVYTVPKTAGGGTAIAAGKKVYWDDTNNVITETPSTHRLIGITVAASLDADTTQDIIHLATAATINAVAGVASGYKIARGTATLDGSNPTTVATGLTTIVAAVATLKSATTPGDDPSWVSVDYTGSDGNLNIYAWKNTGGTDPTLVASTNNAATFDWIAIGT